MGLKEMRWQGVDWIHLQQDRTQSADLRGPYTINHVAQNCFAQQKFAHSRSSQSAPYTINHVAQHAMLRNMIDRVWAPKSEHGNEHTGSVKGDGIW
jgi:hypothetical protein